MTDPKLVEALADLYARFSGWETVNEREREFAAHVIDTLRLVQLPEEPDGWVDEYDIEHNPVGPTLWLTVEKTPGSRPVYILPGDPQEVEP